MSGKKEKIKKRFSYPFFLLCLFVFYSALVSELKGWEKFVSHKEGESELKKAPIVTLKDSKDGKILIEIKNNTGVDLSYNGYSKNSPQLFFKKKKGKTWVAAGWQRCGTGMTPHLLKDNESITFELYHEDKEEVQIFTIFKARENNKIFSIIKLYEKNEG